MKKLLIASILSIALVGCSDSEPPVYKSGMTKNQYNEKFADWFDDKIASSNEADIEKYTEKSTELVNSFQKKAINVNSSEEAKKLVDNLVSEIIAMTENKFKLSKEDWIFIANPKVDDSASKHSQLVIKNSIREILLGLTVQFNVYFPTTVSSVIAGAFQDKESGDIYYNILKESKFPKIIANDGWLEDYEAKKFIIDTAVKIAKDENLYFDVSYEQLKNQDAKIKALKFKYNFELIGGWFPGRSLFEFRDIVESKSKEDYKSKKLNIRSLIGQLNVYKEYLSEKEAYLKKHPNTDWAKKPVEKFKKTVEKYKKALKQANIEFNQAYDRDIKKLNSKIQELTKLEANMKSSLSKRNHNIQVFMKTYAGLLNKGYEDVIVAKFLSNRSQLYGFAEEYETQKNIKLEHSASSAFNNYMEIMTALLK